MSVFSNETQEAIREDVTADDLQHVERFLIDASARTPVMYFYASAVFWLLLQTLLGLISALKIQWPEFLADYPAFTYGRIVAAQENIAVYGWASMAGLGTAIWILARLCRVALPRPGLPILGGVVWNLGVASGVIGILAGFGRAFEFLEFPKSAMAVMFVGYSLVAVWGMVVFLKRREGHVFIAAWYLVAALLWLPWLLAGANALLGEHGVRGVMQAVVAAWYAQNLLGLWLTSLGLGTIYYLIPKVTGKPVHSYSLASIGFWTFALFSVWTGIQRLSGGPIPAWLVTVSIVATILLLIPVVTVTVNYLLTLRGSFQLLQFSPTLRFVFFGALSYTLANVVFLLGSFRSVSAITQFTWFGVAQNHLFIFAFFSMVMFGSMYYIIPRLMGCEWLSGNLIRLHYWGSAYGFAMSIIMLLIAGLVQGNAQSVIRIGEGADPQADFMLSVSAMLPFLIGRGMAQILLCVGHVTFALHFVLMLLRLGRPSGSEPTLFTTSPGGANS